MMQNLKKYTNFIILLLCVSACRKIVNTANNLAASHSPAFTLQGLGDTSLSLKNQHGSVSFQIRFEDSVQERVTLTLANVPAGIKVGDGWVNAGYPTFNSKIDFYESDSVPPPIPGTYPVTLKATGEITGTKTFDFNLVVKNDNLCTEPLIGAYPNCSIRATGVHYYDSVYNDSLVHNMIWFSNFANTGKTVMGIFDCNNHSITIPHQVVDNFTIYGGAGADTSQASRKIGLEAFINGQKITVLMLI